MTADVTGIVMKWFEEVWNQRRRDAMDELMAADCLPKVEGLDLPLT